MTWWWLTSARTDIIRHSLRLAITGRENYSTNMLIPCHHNISDRPRKLITRKRITSMWLKKIFRISKTISKHSKVSKIQIWTFTTKFHPVTSKSRTSILTMSMNPRTCLSNPKYSLKIWTSMTPPSKSSIKKPKSTKTMASTFMKVIKLKILTFTSRET